MGGGVLLEEDGVLGADHQVYRLERQLEGVGP
jgi:hypothetical protein